MCRLVVVVLMLCSEGSWRETRKGSESDGGRGGHVCVAGFSFSRHSWIHHQPCLCCFSFPAGKNNTLATFCPQVDDHRHRPLDHPLHHHSYWQVTVCWVTLVSVSSVRVGDLTRCCLWTGLWICCWIPVCGNSTVEVKDMNERQDFDLWPQQLQWSAGLQDLNAAHIYWVLKWFVPVKHLYFCVSVRFCFGFCCVFLFNAWIELEIFNVNMLEYVHVQVIINVCNVNVVKQD